MNNITGKLNLMSLHAVRKMITGMDGLVDCVVIPVQKNKLAVGEKGIYVDWIAFPIKNKKGESKSTHLIKQSLPKEVREKMSQEELNNMPILGDAQVWNDQAESESTVDMAVQNEIDPLPF